MGLAASSSNGKSPSRSTSIRLRALAISAPTWAESEQRECPTPVAKRRVESQRRSPSDQQEFLRDQKTGVERTPMSVGNGQWGSALMFFNTGPGGSTSFQPCRVS